MLNLDTHILIHGLEDALSPTKRRTLAANEWGVSAPTPAQAHLSWDKTKAGPFALRLAS